jgi:hypothetical protein
VVIPTIREVLGMTYNNFQTSRSMTWRKDNRQRVILFYDVNYVFSMIVGIPLSA